MKRTYDLVMDFKNKFPGSVCWRIKKHCKIIEKHLNAEEHVMFAFAAQKNDSALDFFGTAVLALTNKRILIGKKRVLFGSFLTSVTPDLFNDLKVYEGIIWGKVTIDTVKELIVFSNVSKDGLIEIETQVSEFMMKEKQKYSVNLNQVNTK